MRTSSLGATCLAALAATAAAACRAPTTVDQAAAPPRHLSLYVEAARVDAEGLPWDRGAVPILGIWITDQLFSNYPDIAATVIWVDGDSAVRTRDYVGRERAYGSHTGLCVNRLACRVSLEVPGGVSYAVVATDLDPAVNPAISTASAAAAVRRARGDTTAFATVAKPLADTRRFIAGYLFVASGTSSEAVATLDDATSAWMSANRVSAGPDVRLPRVDSRTGCSTNDCAADEANSGRFTITPLDPSPRGG